MSTITFRAKPETVYNMDNTIAYRRIKIPAIRRQHCDMTAFRSHKRFGPYANSDLFLSLLSRELKAKGLASYLRLDRIPEGVNIDESGFLTQITVTV